MVPGPIIKQAADAGLQEKGPSGRVCVYCLSSISGSGGDPLSAGPRTRLRSRKGSMYDVQDRVGPVQDTLVSQEARSKQIEEVLDQEP